MQVRPAGRRLRACLVPVCMVAASLLTACSDGNPLAFAMGDSAGVFGGQVSTWQRTAGGAVREAGVILPLSTVSGAPATRQHGEGTGPAGAWAVLSFPPPVQQNTLLNHFEMHWNPGGHPPGVFLVPHFDFHFYAIPESEVMAIAPTDTHVPAADRWAAGYSTVDTVQAYQAQIVPQMGFHSVFLADLGHPFTTTMVLGYYGGSLIFVEPMITKEFLQARQSFTMTVPQPPVVGRTTLYPTRFVADYLAASDAYMMRFDNFVDVH